MRQELIQELKLRAELSDEQARHATEVFEAFLRERAAAEWIDSADKNDFQSLFSGSLKFFEDRR